jgi:RNA polymerase sigma-70 factor, ECF subfamily
MSEELTSLSERLAKGDSSALKEIFSRFVSAAYAVALRITKNQQDAEEVVQETFIEVWQRASRYQPERGSLSTWILSIARSRAIDKIRNTKARQSALERSQRQPMIPKEQSESERDQAQVRAHLMQLPEEQRTALELAYFHGLSQNEIAEKTSTPLGTVKTRVRLATSRLAELLKTPRP